VLLDGRWREIVLQVLDESGDMERLDAGELVDVFTVAPGGEAAGGIDIGSAGIVVIDLSREEFQDAFRSFLGGCKERCRSEIRRRPDDHFGGHDESWLRMLRKAGLFP